MRTPSPSAIFFLLFFINNKKSEMLPSPEKEEIIVARFYDDDPYNFKPFQGQGNNILPLDDHTRLQIECILVDDTENPNVLSVDQAKATKPQRSPENHFIQSYFEQKRRRKGKLTPHEQGLEQYFAKLRLNWMFSVTNGITEKQIQDLKRWCFVHRNEYKMVFFDWDRTISTMEGLFQLLHELYTDHPDYMCAYAEYILGGEQRFKRLQNMFSFLRKHHVQVFILTKNGILSKPETIPCFTALVQCIDPQFTPEQFMYTPRGKNKKQTITQKKSNIPTFTPQWKESEQQYKDFLVNPLLFLGALLFLVL